MSRYLKRYPHNTQCSPAKQYAKQIAETRWPRKTQQDGRPIQNTQKTQFNLLVWVKCVARKLATYGCRSVLLERRLKVQRVPGKKNEAGVLTKSVQSTIPFRFVRRLLRYKQSTISTLRSAFSHLEPKQTPSRVHTEQTELCMDPTF